MTAERHLLPAAAVRLDLREERMLDLALYVETRERAIGLYLLALAENAMEVWERERLDTLFDVLVEVFSHPELIGTGEKDILESRATAVAAALGKEPDHVRLILAGAPRRFLLRTDSESLAALLDLVATRPGPFEARLVALPAAKHRPHCRQERLSGSSDRPADPSPAKLQAEWEVHLAALDRPGLLAAIAKALTSLGIKVQEARIFTWENGLAVDTFLVEAPTGTDWDLARRLIEEALGRPVEDPLGAPSFCAPSRPLSQAPSAVLIEGEVEIDNFASPWYTLVEVRARDRRGLLYRVASAMARAGIEIHEATVTTRAGVAVDTFLVTGGDGKKLDASSERALRPAFDGPLGGRSRYRRLLSKQKASVRNLA